LAADYLLQRWLDRRAACDFGVRIDAVQRRQRSQQRPQLAFIEWVGFQQLPPVFNRPVRSAERVVHFGKCGF
jgi:hypothetical protein